MCICSCLFPRRTELRQHDSVSSPQESPSLCWRVMKIFLDIVATIVSFTLLPPFLALGTSIGIILANHCTRRGSVETETIRVQEQETTNRSTDTEAQQQRRVIRVRRSGSTGDLFNNIQTTPVPESGRVQGRQFSGPNSDRIDVRDLLQSIRANRRPEPTEPDSSSLSASAEWEFVPSQERQRSASVIAPEDLAKYLEGQTHWKKFVKSPETSEQLNKFIGLHIQGKLKKPPAKTNPSTDATQQPSDLDQNPLFLKMKKNESRRATPYWGDQPGLQSDSQQRPSRTGISLSSSWSAMPAPPPSQSEDTTKTTTKAAATEPLQPEEGPSEEPGIPEQARQTVQTSSSSATADPSSFSAEPPEEPGLARKEGKTSPVKAKKVPPPPPGGPSGRVVRRNGSLSKGTRMVLSRLGVRATSAPIKRPGVTTQSSTATAAAPPKPIREEAPSSSDFSEEEPAPIPVNTKPSTTRPRSMHF